MNMRIGWPETDPIGQPRLPHHQACGSAAAHGRAAPMPHRRAWRTSVSLRSLRTQRTSLQLVREPPLPELPGSRTRDLAGQTGGIASGSAVFPHGIHAALRTPATHSAKQEGMLEFHGKLENLSEPETFRNLRFFQSDDLALWYLLGFVILVAVAMSGTVRDRPFSSTLLSLLVLTYALCSALLGVRNWLSRRASKNG